MKLRNKHTGEVKEFNEIFLTKIVKESNTAKSEYVERSYCRIAELNADWEDCTPAEPLIKDEKTRAIFKMWADNFKNAMIDGTFTFYVDREYHSFMVNLKPTGESRLDDVAEIDLNFDCDGLEDGKSYTLSELCGEEEKE